MTALPLPTASQPAADTAALRRIGLAVSARLNADPAAWKMPCDGLDLWALGNFLAPDECDRLIAMIDRVARPSTVFGPDAGRTSWSGDFDHYDPEVEHLQRRFDDLVGIEPRCGETIQGQRYQPGQEFRPHYDWFIPGDAIFDRETAVGGQRSWTAMVYLNAVEAGGETEFTHFGIAIPPQPSALLLWNNMKPDGTPNPLAAHAGRPVLAGCKYVITKWYRCRPWRLG